MTQEDPVESRMLELEREFRRHLRAAPELRAAIPRAAQLVYLDPGDPAYNQATLARAAGLPDGPGLPVRRYVLMTDPPRLYDDLPPIEEAPRGPGDEPVARDEPAGPDGRYADDGDRPDQPDWALVAGVLVTGELRAWGALVQAPRRAGRTAALTAFEAAHEAEIGQLRQSGVATPHALVTATRLAGGLLVARAARGLWLSLARRARGER